MLHTERRRMIEKEPAQSAQCIEGNQQVKCSSPACACLQYKRVRDNGTQSGERNVEKIADSVGVEAVFNGNQLTYIL